MLLCFILYDWFAGLDIFNGSVPKKFCLFMPLMILFGAPVCTFEFLLPFLEELPGEGFCTQFLLYIFTIILVLSNFICYQILFTCSFLVVTLPVFFYWPWVNKLIRFFIQKVYYGSSIKCAYVIVYVSETINEGTSNETQKYYYQFLYQIQ